MRSHAAFLPACAVSVLTTLGCGSSDPETISLTNADSGRSVVAAVDDTIEVTLQTIGPGQYANPTLSSGSVAFRGESAAGLPNPGGPRQLYRFAAVAPGRAQITIPHTLDPPAPVIPAFVITVEVR
jgi:hypothetical protein